MAHTRNQPDERTNSICALTPIVAWLPLVHPDPTRGHISMESPIHCLNSIAEVWSLISSAPIWAVLDEARACARLLETVVKKRREEELTSNTNVMNR